MLAIGVGASSAARVMPQEASTPLMRQYHSIKQQVPNALLLFRLGDFYELFYDDAVTAAPSDLSVLLRLDPVARGLLFLVEVEGASIREAAAAVGCTEPAARMRLSRARRRLRTDRRRGAP